MAKSYFNLKTASTGRTATSSVDPAAKEKISGLFAEARALYDTDGDFMKGIEAQLGRSRKRAVASGMQGLASAGLAGTSMMGGFGKKFEEEVAQPALAVATSARLSALSGLLQAEAGAEASLATRYTTTPQSTGVSSLSGSLTSKFGAGPSWDKPRDSSPRPRSESYGLSREERKGGGKKAIPRPLPNLGPALSTPQSTRGYVRGAAAGPLSSYYKGL